MDDIRRYEQETQNYLHQVSPTGLNGLLNSKRREV